VRFRLKPGKRIAVKGGREAAAAALQEIAADRDDVVVLLRERDGDVEEIVEIEISTAVPTLEIQKENYRSWFSARGEYYHPTETQIEKMFAACQEGDEIFFDFAHSFTVRKPNGLLVQVDRRGHVSPPSSYSPALRQGTGK
jgi:hypothetical protein